MLYFDDGDREKRGIPLEELPPAMRRSLAQQDQPALFGLALLDRREEVKRGSLFWDYASTNDVQGLRGLFADEKLVKRVAWSHLSIATEAARHGNTEALDVLLEHGFGREHGRISCEVLCAICNSNLPGSKILVLLDDLMKQGAMLSNEWETPLHRICRVGYLSVVERLLEAGIPVRARSRDTGSEPILDAVSLNQGKNLPLIQFLIDRGADVNAADAKGVTALHRAVLSCDRRVVQTLLDHGANPSPTTREGRDTPLHHAANEAGMSSYYKRLLGHEGASDIVRMLLEKGAEPDAINQEGDTPLLKATTPYVHVDTLRLLLNRGASVNVVNLEGFSPLGTIAAFQRGGYAYSPDGTRFPCRETPDFPPAAYDVIDLLIEHDADPLSGAVGRTAIESAVRFRNMVVLGKLLTNIGSRSVGDKSLSLLHAAAHRDAADCLHLLLPHGLQVGTTYSQGGCRPAHSRPIRRDGGVNDVFEGGEFPRYTGSPRADPASSCGAI
jgi:ankyrin repeat protein